MDALDRKIIELLRLDSNQSNVEIAKKVGLSEAAVRKRITKSTKEGVIKKFTIETGEQASQVNALVLVVVDTQKSPRIADNVKKIQNVRAVYELSGEDDVAVLVSAESVSELNETIDKIRGVVGVRETDTRMILKEHE